MASKSQQKALGAAAAVGVGIWLLTRSKDASAGATSPGGAPGTAAFEPMQPGSQPGKPGDPSDPSTPTAPPGMVGGVVSPSGDPGGGGVVSTIPIPGMLYRIRSGDTLLGVAGTAYQLGSGGARLSASIAINDDPWNRANAEYSSTSGTEASWYGPERLSFLTPYQVIYIPEGF